MYRPQKIEKYPAVMTFSQADTFEIYHSFYDLDEARDCRRRIDGVIYSQTGWHVPDASGETDRYERLDLGSSLPYGLQNENGFWIVVKHKRTFTDNDYVGPMQGCKCSSCS